MIIFLINRLPVQSIKCQKIVKNACYTFPQPKMTSSDVLFCLTDSPESKNIQFTIISDKEKQQIITFEPLESVKYSTFLFI